MANSTVLNRDLDRARFPRDFERNNSDVFFNGRGKIDSREENTDSNNKSAALYVLHLSLPFPVRHHRRMAVLSPFAVIIELSDALAIPCRCLFQMKRPRIVTPPEF